MKLSTLAVASLALIGSSAPGKAAHTMQSARSAQAAQPAVTRADIQAVAPALDSYTDQRLLGDLWKRPGLDERDRSIVTLAALIARNQAIELPYYLGRALDAGVTPSEI